MATPITQRFDVSLWQGSFFDQEIAILRDPTSSERLDLSSYTARAEVRPNLGHPQLLLAIPSDAFTLSEDGVISMKLEAALTQQALRRGYWDVILTIPAQGPTPSREWVVVQGSFSILPRVTALP